MPSHCKSESLNPRPRRFPTHGPQPWRWCCPPLLVVPKGAERSHSERDEAVVSLDVPLEDLWAWPQHTLKARPVQLHTLERTSSDYCGCPGAVQQQGDFTWRRRWSSKLVITKCLWVVSISGSAMYSSILFLSESLFLENPVFLLLKVMIL